MSHNTLTVNNENPSASSLIKIPKLMLQITPILNPPTAGAASYTAPWNCVFQRAVRVTVYLNSSITLGHSPTTTVPPAFQGDYFDMITIDEDGEYEMIHNFGGHLTYPNLNGRFSWINLDTSTILSPAIDTENTYGNSSLRFRFTISGTTKLCFRLSSGSGAFADTRGCSSQNLTILKY